MKKMLIIIGGLILALAIFYLILLRIVGISLSNKIPLSKQEKAVLEKYSEKYPLYNIRFQHDRDAITKKEYTNYKQGTFLIIIDNDKKLFSQLPPSEFRKIAEDINKDVQKILTHREDYKNIEITFSEMLKTQQDERGSTYQHFFDSTFYFSTESPARDSAR